VIRRFPPLAVATGVALALACAATPDNTLAPGHESAPGVATYLLCAPNLVLALPAELESGTGPVRRAIETRLRANDRDVVFLDLFRGRKHWEQAVRRAKESGDLRRTPILFAEALAAERDFQAIVMPSIIMHRTRVSDNAASWDGVWRRMRMINAPSLGSARSQNTLAEGVAYGGIAGEMPVTSLHVLVYTRKGERVFEGRGGLEFVHDIDLSPLAERFQWQPSLRSDLFQDAEVLREGIEIAFSPYLPPVE